MSIVRSNPFFPRSNEWLFAVIKKSNPAFLEFLRTRLSNISGNTYLSGKVVIGESEKIGCAETDIDFNALNSLLYTSLSFNELNTFYEDLKNFNGKKWF